MTFDSITRFVFGLPIPILLVIAFWKMRRRVHQMDTGPGGSTGPESVDREPLAPSPLAGAGAVAIALPESGELAEAS